MSLDLLKDTNLDALLEDAGRDVEKHDSGLLCAGCGNVVTTLKQRISVTGAHAHTFLNPHGFEFEIGCFRGAPGCARHGEATGEWTWFSGYDWRFAVCRQCQTHLGWHYASVDGDAFYGLILNRLAESG